jgi:short-subunit dehydrogenase
MEIKNKVVIITGASQGIGLATAQLLSRMGAKVVLAARSKDIIEKLAKELPDSLAVATDMRKTDDIKNLINATIKKYGRIDVLVNNAGQGMYGPVENIDIGQYKEIMELNIYGVLRAMQAVIPVMRRQGGGQIINISSRVSKNYFPALAAYASTKYALNALSLTARQELEKDNIIVSIFLPKMTATDFNKNALGMSPYWPARPGSPPPEIDTPEQVAEKIYEQIVSGAPEAEM